MKRILLRGLAGAALALAILFGVTRYLGNPWQAVAPVRLSAAELRELTAFADRASAIYLDAAGIRARYGASVAVQDFPESEIRVAVETAPDRGSQWIMVRGTDNLKNVLLDAEFTRALDPELQLPFHRGFELAAREALPWIREQLASGARLRITGHSLGGAVAVLVAAVLHREGATLDRVVTFGQPKLTNRDGVARLRHLPVTRVVHNEDPIPLVPPVTLLDAMAGIYHHFGAEAVFTDDGSSRLLPEHDAEAFAVGSLWEQLGDIRPDDHRIENYLGALRRAAAAAAPAPAPGGA